MQAHLALPECGNAASGAFKWRQRNASPANELGFLARPVTAPSLLGRLQREAEAFDVAAALGSVRLGTGQAG